MKKIFISFLIVLGFGIFWACEDENTNPVFDTTKIVAPTLTESNNTTDLVLLEENEANIALSFTWDSTIYPLANIESAIYSLQMDSIGNNFNDPIELANGDVFNYTITVAELNDLLLGKKYQSDTILPFEFRVYSYIVESVQDKVYSNVLSINITAYSKEVIEVPVEPIYLLGNASAAGWDNTAALPLTFRKDLADSTFTIVTSLDGGTGEYLKFIRYLGAWAPQWGTDATGDSVSGNLVYRPTEAVPDPAAIPAPSVAGDYLITVNIAETVNTYEITKVAETLHLIGDATSVDWDNTQAIPMTKDAPGKFSIVTTLESTATEGFKFLVNQGAWEPMYVQDGNGTWEAGSLKYRPLGAADVPSIPPPPTTGSYLIEVDFANNTYKLTLQ
ncbi:MAG TPA: hypothetical protein DEQ03_19790 [Marinilabiliales bacterium]|nr:hypothetical protein [Marinilabiliales bacterium]